MSTDNDLLYNLLLELDAADVALTPAQVQVIALIMRDMIARYLDSLLSISDVAALWGTVRQNANKRMLEVGAGRMVAGRRLFTPQEVARHRPGPRGNPNWRKQPLDKQ